MEQTARPLRKSDYRLELLDNEILLFCSSENKSYYFNQSASLIWQLCDGRHTVAEITKMIAEVYPKAASEMDEDVGQTLGLFLEYGCIELT